MDNNTISIQKVLKGSYDKNAVGVITESQYFAESPKFTNGENVILFLTKEPWFGLPILTIDKLPGNDYSVVNLFQGKYEINEDGLVSGFASDTDIHNMTIPDIEKKVVDAIINSNSNSTQSANDIDYYINDTDLIAPESERVIVD